MTERDPDQERLRPVRAPQPDARDVAFEQSHLSAADPFGVQADSRDDSVTPAVAQEANPGGEDHDREAILGAAGAWVDRDDDGAAYVERLRGGSRSDTADVSNALSGDMIGPFYDEEGLARLLGMKPVELAALRQQKLVLSVPTTGPTLFPVWQFGAHGELLPELPAVRDVLDPVLPNDLTIARWLHTPAPRFDGRSAADLLRSGETATVLAAARKDAHRLAQ